MALTPEQREDVFRVLAAEAAESAQRSGALLRQLYDLIFATNTERLAAVRAFLDAHLAAADTALAAHDTAVAAAKVALQATRADLAALRSAV